VTVFPRPYAGHDAQYEIVESLNLQDFTLAENLRGHCLYQGVDAENSGRGRVPGLLSSCSDQQVTEAHSVLTILEFSV